MVLPAVFEAGKAGGNYSGTRGTPTVDGDTVYALAQFGDLVQRRRHRSNLLAKESCEDFSGSSGGWNYSESVPVDGNNVICSPEERKQQP